MCIHNKCKCNYNSWRFIAENAVVQDCIALILWVSSCLYQWFYDSSYYHGVIVEDEVIVYW